MNTRTLTSADCIFTISVDPLFPVAVRIQGFSADDITDIDAQTIKETSMGVDGRLSAGFIPAPAMQNVTLQADSQSNDFFDAWATYERTYKRALVATGQIILPAVDKVFICARGFLTTYAPMPAARKTLQPRRHTLTWQSVTPTPEI
ncbi:phage tail fiber protein [Novosphingobium olei]|uniref:Phage tail protein n=1 Tax=Novosphingobium olei TaxID=2728851 RepID=A0A7Y0BP52_9SPHN|nr:hypothetical protein [Novosphingobium olei]NML93805.1 hypothetical protein [Novosphingobium olei]